MPIAIVYQGVGAIPAILKETTSAALIKSISELKGAPRLSDEEEARLWLLTLEEPSGWFDNAAEALSYTNRLKSETRSLSAQEVRGIVDSLNMTQSKVAEALGIGGNPQTKRTAMQKFVKGTAPLGKERSRKLLALAASKGLDVSKEGAT